MKTQTMMIAAALLAAPAVHAAEMKMPTGAVDLYYLHNTFDPDPGGSDSASGIGVRGWATITGPWFGAAQYETSDHGPYDIQDARIGGGYAWINDPATVYAMASYVNFGNDLDQDGVALDGGVRYHLTPQFDLKGELGWIGTQDTSGLEGAVGGQFAFNRNWGAFAEYHMYGFNGSGGTPDGNLSDLRIGASYMF